MKHEMFCFSQCELSPLDLLRYCDILPTSKGGGFWYQQTLPAGTGLNVSPLMADAPAMRIFIAALISLS